MVKIKTAISIDATHFHEVEAISQELNLPRSQVVDLALEKFIQAYRNKQLLDQINDAYNEPATDEEADLLQKMHKRQMEHLENDPW